MPHASVNGVDLCHDGFGDPDDPIVLLVGGLGQQMIEWEPEFCEAIAAHGFRVVRFDNRDAGLSTHLDVAVDPLAVLAAMGAGDEPDVPYRLADMAGDAAGLLDHLGVARAHVVGASMGGMIAQSVAIAHPERVATLTSIMSNTGEPGVGAPTAEAMAVLAAPPPRTREEAQDNKVLHARTWGSPSHLDEARLRALAAELWDRSFDPEGTARQLAAVAASGSRAEGLRSLTVPTLVMHGTEDRLVAPDGGERTAALVPDAKLSVVEGMGHDLPPPVWPRVVEDITTHIARHRGA